MLLACKRYPISTHIPPVYYLQLGVQSNPDSVLFDSLVRACNWIPSSKTKSFTIFDFVHTDYHGNEVYNPTGYASFRVKYFSTESEGMFKVADYIEHTYIGKYNNGKPTHNTYGNPIRRPKD